MKKLLFTITWILTVSLSFCQSDYTVVKLTTLDGSYEDRYSCDVAYYGNFAVVGAEGEDLLGSSLLDYGTAYVYEKNFGGVWNQKQQLFPAHISQNEEFGTCVGIYGNYIMIGAPFDHEDGNEQNPIGSSGSVTIYYPSGDDNEWEISQKIVGSLRSKNGFFGNALSMDGNYALVGSHGYSIDKYGPNEVEACGAAFVFELNDDGQWIETQSLIASDRKIHDFFGHSVSIVGNRIIIGAPECDLITTNDTLMWAGAAYIFEKDNNGIWHEVQKLIAPVPAVEDFFGYDVAIYGDYAVVGAPLEDEDEYDGNKIENSGSAYLYKRDGTGYWNMIKKIVFGDRYFDDWFGRSVSLSETILAIGIPGYNQPTSSGWGKDESGSVALYKKTDNEFVEMNDLITATTTATMEYFGMRVELTDETIIVSSPGYLDDRGAAYVFELNGLGLDHNENDTEITVWPNPTADKINIKLNKRYSKVTVKITDITGRVIIKESYLSPEKINLEIGEITGLIILEIQTDNEPVITKKIIKTHN